MTYLRIRMKRREVLQLAASGAALSLLPAAARAAPLKELRLDYAYYSPTSLVLRRFGWLEEEFKADGTAVKWVHSAGSNRALEYLNANSIDIGSSAGLAALLAFIAFTLLAFKHRASAKAH